MMALELFLEKMDALGSDLSIWPEEDRKQAEALLNASPVARAYFTADQSVDQAFERNNEHAPVSLLDKIMDAVGDDTPA